jgi:hypothetical protein
MHPPVIDWPKCYSLLHLFELLDISDVLKNVQRIDFNMHSALHEHSVFFAVQVANYLGMYPKLNLYLH